MSRCGGETAGWEGDSKRPVVGSVVGRVLSEDVGERAVRGLGGAHQLGEPRQFRSCTQPASGLEAGLDEVVKSFSPGYLEKQPIPHSLLQTVRLLGEFRGKEALFERQAPQSLETLRAAAVIQSTESSNRIEGVVAPLERIQAPIAEKTRPKNRFEQEIAGYRDVLNTIHTSWSCADFLACLVMAVPSWCGYPLRTARRVKEPSLREDQHCPGQSPDKHPFRQLQTE